MHFKPLLGRQGGWIESIASLVGSHVVRALCGVVGSLAPRSMVRSCRVGSSGEVTRIGEASKKCTEVEDGVRHADLSPRSTDSIRKAGQPIRTRRAHRSSLWQGRFREDVVFGNISGATTVFGSGFGMEGRAVDDREVPTLTAVGSRTQVIVSNGRLPFAPAQNP
uniref:Uncharacterized protein n=1 Tax=Caenorhabditis japonica TaxID=281687 RepID=A0A8R1IF68_CAEJA